MVGVLIDFSREVLSQLPRSEVLTFALFGALMFSSGDCLREKGLKVLAGRFALCLFVHAMMNAFIDTLIGNFIVQALASGVLFCLLIRDFDVSERIVYASLFVSSWSYSSGLIILAGVDLGRIGIAAMRVAYILAVFVAIRAARAQVLDNESEVPLSLAVLMMAICLAGISSLQFLLVSTSDLGASQAMPILFTCLSNQIVDIISYVLFAFTVRGYAERLRNQRARHLLEARLEALQAFRLSEQSLRELRHEVKNQYAYIATLLEQGAYGEAEAFFGEMQTRAAPTLSRVNSGNAQVDDIVNLEIAKALEAGLTVDARIAVPPQLPYDDLDLCSLISNLLDNATEACVRAGGGSAAFSMTADAAQGALLVVAKNPCAEEPRRDARGRLVSSKAEEGHGCGTGVVCRIAQSYGGVADFSWADGTFTARVLLDLPAQEGE